MNEVEKVQVLETPIKSEGDKKDYRVIKLPNGLKALLIYKTDDGSSSENIAAASMTVEVGSFDDPPNVMGLAHFLEHILFMGSAKYPGENSYNDFLVANGGSDNAMTSSEFTGFYFKVSEKAFPEALDIFAQQFISPLLLKEAMQREREAVDSEYQMATSRDNHLAQQVIKTLIFDNHPASQFDCGNLKTLKEDISDDDLHRELLKFFEKYVASKMNLCIQSKKTLDEMQELVVKSFSAVKSGSEEVKSAPPAIEEIFRPEFFTKIHYVKPKSSRKTLAINWALPPFHQHYKCSPLDYIFSIFDNDGEGGIASYLKEKQWITSFSSFIHNNSFTGNSQFTIPKLSMQMSDQGAANIEKILEAIFSYLLMIQEIPVEEHRRLFQELKEKKEIEFKYHKERGALMNVQSAMSTMILYENIDILRGSFLYQEYDEKLILDSIKSLNERKFQIMIMDSDHQTYNKKEKYFEVNYDELDFPEAYQQLWDERKLNPEFFAEKPNPFRITNFEIFTNEEESPVRTFEFWSIKF